MPPMPPGYPDEAVDARPDELEDLRCIVCHEIFQNPVKLAVCDHVCSLQIPASIGTVLTSGAGNSGLLQEVHRRLVIDHGGYSMPKGTHSSVQHT